MSNENALVTLLREGVSVQEASVDSKRDLEDALRSACNDFIEHTCKTVAGDLMQFLEKNKGKTTPDGLNAVLTKTSENLDNSFADVLTQMGLYLDNPATQSILLKPVSRKIVKALEEAKREVQGGSEGWDDETKGETLATLAGIEQKVKSSSRAPAAK